MVVGFDIRTKILSLSNPSLGAVSGIYRLVAPNGQPFYQNTGWEDDSFTSPDFTNGSDVFETFLPVDITGNVMQTTPTTDYVFQTRTSTGGEFVANVKYSKLTAGLSIGRAEQNCFSSQAIIPATITLPAGLGASILSATWTITSPNGTSSLYIPPSPNTSIDCIISPIVTGLYQLSLTVTYAYSSVQGGSDINVIDSITATSNYTSTCGNAADVLCKASCLLSVAIKNNNQQAMAQLSALVSAITGNLVAIQNGGTCTLLDAQALFDIVINRLEASGLYDPDCGCGC